MLVSKSLKRYKNKNSFTKCDFCSSFASNDQRLIAGKIGENKLKKPLFFSLRAKAHGKGLLELKRSFNSSLQQSIEKKCFWNQTFDKGRLKNFVLWFFLKYGEHKTVRLVEELKTIGFQYATKAGISLGVEDLKIPPKKAALINEAESLSISTIRQFKRGEITEVERFQRLIDTWHRTSEQLKVEVIENFEGTDVLNPVYMMAFSGARGNISQVRQLVGMRGLMSNPQGQIIDFPIRSNFREGLTLTEYIISSYGARKGIVDTALRTANAGYLTRRLVDVAQHVIISSTDCGTNRGIFLTDMKEGNKTIYSLQNRLIGRVLARDIYTEGSSNIDGTVNKKIKIASKNTEISADLATLISQHHKKVFVRSPLTCQTNKLVCQLCYGWSLAQGNLVSIGEAVGIVAAQSIGEPGTQLTMRTFHTGGVFAGNVSDQIKAPYDGFVIYKNPIAGKLIRTPEGKIAFLTKDEGSFSIYKYPIKETFSDSAFNTTMGIRNFSPKSVNLDTLEKRNYKIPFYTLLFSRNGEKVFQKQVIAQITSINRQKTATDQAEFTIKAEISGLFYSKNLEIEETKVGPVIKDNIGQSMPDGANDSLLDTINRSWSWGYAWILSGQIYQLPLPSSFFPIFGDFVNKKSFINCINWYMPNSFGSGFKLNRPLNLNLFNTKSLKLMRKSSYQGPSGINGPLKLDFSLDPSNTNTEGAKGTKNGLIEKDFKLLKFDLISFELSKITYKNIGYFLKLSKPFSEENKIYQNTYNQFNNNLVNQYQKNLVQSYKKNVFISSNKKGQKQLLETVISQKSILSYQDNLFLFSSLFPRNRYFNDLKTNKSLQTNNRNPLINPSTWEPSFNVFLNWFPKRFFTQTAGLIFFDTRMIAHGVAVGEHQKKTLAMSYLHSKVADSKLTGHRTGLYVDSCIGITNKYLKVSKNSFTFSKNKKMSNSILEGYNGSTDANTKLIEKLKTLSFPTFFKKDLLDPNNQSTKVNLSKMISKNTKKSNSGYLPDTQKVRTHPASIDASTTNTGLLELKQSFNSILQAETTFKNTLNKNLKLNTLLQTTSYEQYPQNLLGSQGPKASDGTPVVFEESKILGYPWKNGFKYNWGLLKQSAISEEHSHSRKTTKDFSKTIFERALLVRQPFYKIRDKNNSIVIGTIELKQSFNSNYPNAVDSYHNLRKKQLKTQQNFSENLRVSTKTSDLTLIQSNRQGKNRLIEFNENFAQIISICPSKNPSIFSLKTSIDSKNNNKVKEFCPSGTDLTKKLSAASYMLKGQPQKKVEDQLELKRSFNSNQLLKRKAFYTLPTSFSTSNKKQESLVKRKFIFGMLPKTVKEFYSIPDKNRQFTKTQNKPTTLKSYCKTTSIPYFLPTKIQNIMSMSAGSKGSTKNISSILNLKTVKTKAKKHHNTKPINIFNFYFYSLFNKKAKHKLPENFKKLRENKYQLICSPYLENQLEQLVNLSFSAGHTQISLAKTEMFQRSQQLQNWFKKAIAHGFTVGLPIENNSSAQSILFGHRQPKKLKKWNKKKVRHDLFIWNTLSKAKGHKQPIRKKQEQITNKNKQKNKINNKKSFSNTRGAAAGGALPIELKRNFNSNYQETNINLWLKNGHFYYTTDLTKFFLYNKKIIQPGSIIDQHFSFDKNTVYLEIIPLKKLTTNFLLETNYNTTLTNPDTPFKMRSQGVLNAPSKPEGLRLDTDNKGIQGQIALNKKLFIKEQKWLKTFQKENKITIIKEINPNLKDKAQSKKIIELDFSQTLLNKNCRFKVEKTRDHKNSDSWPRNKAKSSLQPQFTELNITGLKNRNTEGPKDIEVANYIIFIRKTSEYQFIKEIEYKKDIYSLSNQKSDTLLLSTIKVNNICAPSMPNRLAIHMDKKNHLINTNRKITRSGFILNTNCLPQKIPGLKKQLLQNIIKNKVKQNKAFLNFQCTKLKRKMLNQTFHSIRLFSNYQTGLLNKQKTSGQIISKYGSSQLKLIFNNTLLSGIIKKEKQTRDLLASSKTSGHQKPISILEGIELKRSFNSNYQVQSNNLKAEQNGKIGYRSQKNNMLFDKVRTWGLPSLLMMSLKSFNLSPFILSYKSPYSVNFPFKTPMCFFSQQYQSSFLFNNPWTGPAKTEMLHFDSSSIDTKIKIFKSNSRLTRYKQLKSSESTTLKQLLANYIYKIQNLNTSDKNRKIGNTKKGTDSSTSKPWAYGHKKLKNNATSKPEGLRLFEIGKNFSNLSSIFLSPIVDYSLINEFPKSIPATLFQEQSYKRGSSVDGQRASIFNNTNLKKQTLFLNHSDNKKFLFGKTGPLLPSLASGSPTSNNSFSRFNQTNEELGLNIKKALYKADFVSYIDNSVNSQNPVMKTYAYSSLEGELVYQKKTLKKMDLEPSILYKEIITLKKELPGLSINKLIRQKFTDFFLSTKPVNHIDYSCMILTKKDQICYSLLPKSGSFSGKLELKRSFNSMKQKKLFKQKYKEIYFSLENQKKETQYFINNIVINLLNLLITETNTDIGITSNSSDANKTSEESKDSSKYHMDELLSGLLKMDFTVPDNAGEDSNIPTTITDGEKESILKNTKTTLAESGALELNKIPAGLAQQRSKLLIGEFLVYGDKINPELAISKSGQIIHINNFKVTLRKGQPIFVSPQAILHKYDGDFIEEQSSVITLAYQQLKTGDIVQGIPKIEQFFEARTTKRGRLFRDSLDNLLKAIFNRYNTKLPREQAVRQSFYKIQQIIMDGVQRVYRSQGVTIADKHLEVIVKQMTSKVRITFGGSTGYLPGEICDLYDIELINKDIRPKILYEPIVLGITKASLEVKSFLSAASFQQTTRVLTKAALSRKTDYLNGLKENVILGNLIPAGTGYLVYLDQYSTSV